MKQGQKDIVVGDVFSLGEACVVGMSKGIRDPDEVSEYVRLGGPSIPGDVVKGPGPQLRGDYIAYRVESGSGTGPIHVFCHRAGDKTMEVMLTFHEDSPTHVLQPWNGEGVRTREVFNPIGVARRGFFMKMPRPLSLEGGKPLFFDEDKYRVAGLGGPDEQMQLWVGSDQDPILLWFEWIMDSKKL